MRKSDHCKGRYCQLCWLLLLLHGTMLSLFHEDQLGQSNFCVAWPGRFYILWSTKLVAVWCNFVDVAYRDVTQKVFDWRICCDGGRRQTSFIAGAMALHCNGKGLQLTWSILLWALWRLHDHLRLWLSHLMWWDTANRPCGKRLIVALHEVRGQLPLWQGAHHCLLWWMRPPWHTRHTRPWRCTCPLWHTGTPSLV